MGGLDLEALPARRMLNVICELFIEDGIGPAPEYKEVLEGRDRARARLLRVLGEGNAGYNSAEEYDYGSSNDSFGTETPQSDAPLPYIPPTEQTEDGYAGLDPPMGV